MVDRICDQRSSLAKLALMLFLLLLIYPFTVPPVILGIGNVHQSMGMGVWRGDPLWMFAEAYATPIGFALYHLGESELYVDYQTWWLETL